MSASVALAVAAALHAGFQLTVTVLVYPVLARVPAPGWSEAHARHSRLITPLVVLVYGALAATCVWVVADERSTAGLLAVGAAVLCVVVTAVGAAPTHGRLGRLDAPDPALLRRLLALDRARGALAVLCLTLALLAV